MKPFKNYDIAKQNASRGARAQLPLGTYVCKILKVESISGNGKSGDRINIYFDITEGAYKDFFNKDYYSNTNEDKKWRGKYLIWLPKDDGTKEDGWTKDSFAKWTLNFEESNPGYTWDWDENKWKGLSIGITYRECGKVIDGNSVKFNEVAFPVSVDFARENPDYVGKFKAYKGYSEEPAAAVDDSFLDVPFDVTEGEIPF